MTRQAWIEVLAVAALIIGAAGLLGAAWVLVTDVAGWAWR